MPTFIKSEIRGGYQQMADHTMSTMTHPFLEQVPSTGTIRLSGHREPSGPQKRVASQYARL